MSPLLRILMPCLFLALPLGDLVAGGLHLGASTRDWAALGREAAAEGVPVAILVTAEDCAYCELLKQRLLGPMQRAGAFDGRLVGAELSLDAGGKVLDFDGERVRTRLFLNRYGVFATPTLILVDAQGRLLHDPIVGFNGSEDYRSLLEEALQSALAALGGVDHERGVAALDSP